VELESRVFFKTHFLADFAEVFRCDAELLGIVADVAVLPEVDNHALHGIYQRIVAEMMVGLLQSGSRPPRSETTVRCAETCNTRRSNRHGKDSR